MLPVASKAVTRKTDFSGMQLSTTTTTSTTGNVEIVVETSAVPSSRLLRAPSKIKAIQVEVKTFISFSQIVVNKDFNCNIKFPGVFSNLITYFTIVNLDMVPSLGLACSFEGFDYADQVVFVTAGPLLAAAPLGAALVWMRVRRARSAKKEASAQAEQLES